MEERPGSDRRLMLGMLLAIAALQVYFYVTTPNEVIPTTVSGTATEAARGETSSGVSGAAPSGVASDSTAKDTTATDSLGLVDGAPAALNPLLAQVKTPTRNIPFRVCDVDALITTDGGVLRDARLSTRQADLQATPIWSWAFSRLSGGGSGDWVPYASNTGSARLLSPVASMLAMGAGGLDAASPQVEVLEESPSAVVLRGVTTEGIEVKRSLRVGKDCVVDIDASWTNLGSKSFDGTVWMGAHDALPESSGQYTSVMRPLAVVDGSLEKRDKLDALGSPEAVEGAVRWFGLSDRYFASYVLPPDGGGGSLVFSARGGGSAAQHGAQYVTKVSLAPGASTNQHFRLYLGTLDLPSLNSVGADLAKAVDFGWFAFFAKILLWLMKKFESVVGNWGVAIILLTFVVKLLLFPLTQISFKSSQAMQAIQPRLQEIRSKHADNPEELNRQTIELFKTAGVNPVGGCLPMLLQMPIWIALYNVLLNSVELYQTKFLYLRDLTSPDPYAVLPLVVVVLMMVQQQMMPMGNMDPAQQRIMKYMPLLFGLFFFSSPSGLVVYIFVNMVLTILQQWLIKRTYGVATVPV